MARPSGLDRGFAVYDDPFGAGENATTREGEMERRASAVVDPRPALAGAAAQRALLRLGPPVRPALAPYEPPAALRERFAKSPYDGEVAYADAQLGRLIEWLDRTGLRETTLVIVTSDHGEGLGDHGEDEHMLLVYDSTLRVPLILSRPGRCAAGSARRRASSAAWTSCRPCSTCSACRRRPRPASRAAARLRGQGRIPDNESVRGEPLRADPLRVRAAARCARRAGS